MFKKIDAIVDTDLPILINGWVNVKKLYPKQKITNKKIAYNIFWTFSEKEKRTENLNDTQNFKNYCINYLESKYNYYFLNPFELSISNIKTLISKINRIKEDKFYYSENNHLFFLLENYIFGINMDFMFNCKINEKRIKKWLISKNFKIIEDSSIFNKEEFNNKKYLIPILGKEGYEEQFIIGYIFE